MEEHLNSVKEKDTAIHNLKIANKIMSERLEIYKDNSKVAELQKQIDILTEAVEYFALKHWIQDCDIARQALKKIKDMNNE